MVINTEELCSDVLSKIEEITVSDIPNSFNEEYLVEEYKRDFRKDVRERGLDYYHDGNVLKVCKHKNRYIAFVEGSEIEPYRVTLDVHESYIEYECSCPCTYPCKHEYAVLLAISNGSYDEVELKKEIPEKNIDMKAVLQSVPAEEIKNFFINNLDECFINLDELLFKKVFRKYLPKQKYEYYYNGLYNELVLNEGYSDRLYEYLMLAKEYLDNDEFREVFKIVKSIVNAYHDSGNIRDDEFVNVIMQLGMYLRITYRKGDETTVQMIHNWRQELERVNYFESYYLEDIILSIK